MVENEFPFGAQSFGEGNSSPNFILLLHLLSFCLLWLVFFFELLQLAHFYEIFVEAFPEAFTLNSWLYNAWNQTKTRDSPKVHPIFFAENFPKKPRNNSKYNTFAAALALDAKGHATPLGSVGSAWVKCPAEPRSQKSWL